ncbi:MAG TPA: hydroxymethylbilane synthase [Burkholderiales bacterium]|nr:hydroxymethylbilane synthase [Burkholderiales bacterium]
MTAGVKRIVLTTRESALAMWQARHVATRLKVLHPGLEIEISGMTTEGDRRLDTSLAKIGGKGLFVKDLEDALARGAADIAVHSMKDVPMQLQPGHVIGAVAERADPRDAFVSNNYPTIEALAAGARVGTSSLRRESQLRAARPDLVVLPLRGNVPTRLRKLDEEQYDAILLAAAGLKRLALSERIRALLSTESSLPAAGQGAIGVECRADRADLIELLRPLDHAPTALAVRAERAVARTLAGSCNVPLGAYAEVSGDTMRLRGYVGSPDGARTARAVLEGSAADPEALGIALAERLRAAGAAEILASLEASGVR